MGVQKSSYVFSMDKLLGVVVEVSQDPQSPVGEITIAMHGQQDIISFLEGLIAKLGVAPSYGVTGETDVAGSTQSQAVNTASVEGATVAKITAPDPIADISQPNLSGAPKTLPDLGHVDHMGGQSQQDLTTKAAAATLVQQQVDTKPVLLATAGATSVNLTNPPAASGFVVNNSAASGFVAGGAANVQVANNPQQSQQSQLPLSESGRSIVDQFSVANATAAQSQVTSVCGLSVVAVDKLDGLTAESVAIVTRDMEKASKKTADKLRTLLRGVFPATAYEVIDKLDENALRTLTANVIISSAKNSA